MGLKKLATIKVFLKEGLILIVLSIISILIVGYGDLEEEAVDIQLHDTYYVVSKSSLIFIIFLFLIYLVYIARKIVEKFRSIIPNFILLIITTLLIAYTYIFFRPFLFLDESDTAGGWVIYTPLSALPQEYDTKIDDTVKIIFFIIQLIFISTALVVGWQLYKVLKKQL